MNRALLAKELRALRPMIWCIVGLFVVCTAFLVATELPDAQPLTPEIWVQKSRDGVFAVLALFTLMIGAGLLIQESEQGTLRFLDGLPLGRGRLFVVKTASALLVLALVPGLGWLTDVGGGLMSRSSVDPKLPWSFSFAVAGLQMVAAFYLLAIAMVVSFVRSWFALVAGLLFWTYLWLRQSGVEWLAYVDPHALLAPVVVDERVHLPWPEIGAHMGAGLLMFLIAWLGFRHLGDRSQRLADQLSRNRLLHGLGTGLKLLAPIVWLAALIHLTNTHNDRSDEDDATPGIPVGEKAFKQHQTKRYEFLLRTAQWDEAKKLVEKADEDCDAVAKYLGAPPPPTRFVVDLASPVIEHAAGQTNWTKIRMPVMPGQTLDEQRQILGHETTHAFIEQFGNGRLTTHFASIRALHEGLATHVEYALFANDEERLRQRRAVAGAWLRGKIPFGLLVNNETLCRQRDPNLVYPLGAELARVLIETQGHDAPAKLLRSFSRPTAPAGLSGAELWRDAMQAAGLSSERVIAAYESACAEIAESEKEFVVTVPKLSAKVAVEGEDIVIRPTVEGGGAGGKVVCMIEDDTPFGAGLRVLPRREDGTFVLSRTGHPHASLRYLLGWSTKATMLPIFEPWVEAALK